MTKIHDVINRYSEKQNNLYTYPYIDTEYKNIDSKITCICQMHGEFVKTGSQITKIKYGFCPQCMKLARGELANDKFLSVCNQKHSNKYDYSLSIFTGQGMKKDKIIIICPIHGQFKQNAGVHYMGHGCNQCVQGSISYKALTWLDFEAAQSDIIIEHAGNVGEYQIPTTLYKVDGYCRATNTCYEFHGDSYHGNLNRYPPDSICNHFSKLTANELYHKTIERENKIKSMGYKLIVMWESAWNNLKIPNNSYAITCFKTNKELLEDISIYGITLLDSTFLGYKQLHSYKCLICNTAYKTTLTRRKQLFQQFNSVGCPACNKSKTS